MPEYILYDLDGGKHLFFHMIDVRTALDTGLYTAERPEKKQTYVKKSKPEKESQFNSSIIEINKTPKEKLLDSVETKSDIDKIEDEIKSKVKYKIKEKRK